MIFEKIKNERKIQIAIVGCGRISNNHLKAIAHEYKRLKLVAFCDSDIKKLKYAQKNFASLLNLDDYDESNYLKPSEYNDFHSLIKDVKERKLFLDLIILTTPSGLHAEQTIASANAGINVCTEKPMATTWHDGLTMVKACKDSNVRLFVVKQNRYNKTIKLLKKQLSRGRFGKIAIISVNVFWQRPQEYYDADFWRGKNFLDGGALMNQASHYIDLLHYLGGPIKTLSASTATLARSIEAEDTASLQLKWSNNALGTMTVTMLTYPENLEGSITVLGENGTVKIGGVAVNKIDHWKFKDNHPDDLKIKDVNSSPKSVYGLGHYAYYSNMIDVMHGNEKPICDGEEGLKTLEIIIAAYQSSLKQEFIKLPLPR